MTSDVAIAGVGQTPFSRASGVSARALALHAAQDALADADMGPSDIDGIIPVGGAIHAEDLIMALRLSTRVDVALAAPGGNSAVDSLALARKALLAGAATVVLVVFARNGSSEQRISRRVGALPGQQFREQLERPHGWTTPAQWYSMICRRHMHAFGTTRKHLAAVALTMRDHAQLNPAAMMRGRLLTWEEYASAPMIADPYRKFDCCLESDGAAALLVTLRERHAEAVSLRAVASARPPHPDDLSNRPDWFHIGLTDAAPLAFEEAGVGPDDISAAMVYDCFTFEVLHQLEECGFCARGEGGRFAADGEIRLGGKLPVNPHGGLLSEAHLGGMNHIVEAVRQVRGVCGPRQVEAARLIAVTGWGDWGDGSLAIVG